MSIDWSKKKSEGDLIAEQMDRLVSQKKGALRDQYRIQSEMDNLPCDFDIGVCIKRMVRNHKDNVATRNAIDNIKAVRDAEDVIDSLTTPQQVENYDVVTMPDWA